MGVVAVSTRRVDLAFDRGPAREPQGWRYGWEVGIHTVHGIRPGMSDHPNYDQGVCGPRS